MEVLVEVGGDNIRYKWFEVTFRFLLPASDQAKAVPVWG